MKTSTLTGADLNRAVALALGHEVVCADDDPTDFAMIVEGYVVRIPNYATDITAAWPIIVANKIELAHNGFIWCARGTSPPTLWQKDDDPITAAMRCFVASVFGDDVNLENT